MHLAYEDSEKQIKAFGRRVLNRMRAAGAVSTQLEDVVGELRIAWCEARNRWNSQTGVPFGAYLYRGMRNHINRWAQNELDVHNIAPFSFNKEVFEQDEVEFIDILKPNIEEPSIEDQLISRDEAKLFLDDLSDDTRKLVELLISPPEFLIEELKKMQARARYGRTRGLCSSSPKQLTISFIMDALGLSQGQRRAVSIELRAAVAKLEGRM
jgi:DNA-directed RNA polymerase specialized sigma24 family protein